MAKKKTAQAKRGKTSKKAATKKAGLKNNSAALATAQNTEEPTPGTEAIKTEPENTEPKAPAPAKVKKLFGKKAKEKRRSKTPYSRYSSFRLQPRITVDKPKLPGGFKLFKLALGILWHSWKPFLGIVVVYGIFNVILVQSFATLDLSNSRSALEGVFSGHWSQLWSGLSLFAYLVGSSSNTVSQTAGAYQLMLIILSSLATIWALRQVYVGRAIRVRDAYYKGMYPLIPFVLVIAMIAVQLIPIAIGSYLYGFAGQGGALGTAELTLWIVALFMLTVLSLYLLSSSLFALYIACLPDVSPMQALRSARQLVRYRRWTVIRRILVLPIVILVFSAIVMVPTIIFAEKAAVWLFFILSMFLIPTVHAYMYVLYRELLKDD